MDYTNLARNRARRSHGFVFLTIIAGTSLLSTSSQAQDFVSSRKVDADSFLAELEAEGVSMVALEPSKKRIVPPTPEQAKAARFAEVLTRGDEFPEQDVLVTLQLGELPLSEIVGLGSLPEEEREDVVALRAQAIEEAQGDFRKFVEGKGVTRLSAPYKLRNRLSMYIPPDSLSEILSHPDVQDVYPGWYQVVLDWTLQEYRDETFIQEFHDAGYFGNDGGRGASGGPTAPIQIAIVEPGSDNQIFGNQINGSHINWQAPGVFGSRIISKSVCVSSGCSLDSSSSYGSHATWVGSIAAGGLQAFGAWAAGMVPSARIRAMRWETTSVADAGGAIDLAASSGVDSINMSWSTDNFAGQPMGNGCDPNLDLGLNDPIHDAYEAGSVIVKTTSNDNDILPGVCNAAYPAQRPELVTVGAVGAAGDPLPYVWSALAPRSGRGFMSVTRGGSYGGTFDMSVTSMVAPGRIDNAMNAGPSAMDYAGGPATSFAAPVVSGAAGLFREWMNDEDPSKKDEPGHIRAMLLAMGNGQGARTLTTTHRSGVGPDYGAGKIMAHPPNLLPGGDFEQTKVKVQEATSYITMMLPQLPSNTKVLKIGSYVEVTDLSQVPQIFVLIKDRCNGNTTIGYDTWLAEDKMVRLSGSAVNSGVCPNVQLYGLSVPAGGVNVYTFAYWTSGPEYEH